MLTRVPALSLAGRAVLAEGLGTFGLVLAVVCTGNPLYIAMMLVSQVFAYGFVSGAAYNPAVTLACMLIGALPWKTALAYCVVQVVSGIVAAFSGALILHNGDLHAQMPSDTTRLGIFRAFFAEFICTTILCLVVIHVAVSRQKGNHFFGLAIGFVVGGAAASAAPASGAGLNPAVSTGIQIAQCVLSSCEAASYAWLYWIAALGAAVVAALLFRLLNGDDYEYDGNFGEESSRLLS